MTHESNHAQLGRGTRVVIAPDKFRSSASAPDLRRVLSDVVSAHGLLPDPVAISDGGEGLLEALGGESQFTTVTGPLGDPVRAEWRLREDPGGETTAIIEMARASGLALVGDPTANDPMRASSRGTGELIRAAVERGATTIIVGCGGSASTDGGQGALEVLDADFPRNDVAILVACDVTTTFLESPAVFAPQKGASPPQIHALRVRLERLAEHYRTRYGVDVRSVSRGGAAGGLAGGLFAIGGTLSSGINLVADEVGLDKKIRSSALVITGEGRFDATSLAGKIVGALIDRTRGITRLLIIGGSAEIALDQNQNPHATVVDLTDRFGSARAFHETLACVRIAAAEAIESIET